MKSRRREQSGASCPPKRPTLDNSSRVFGRVVQGRTVRWSGCLYPKFMGHLSWSWQSFMTSLLKRQNILNSLFTFPFPFPYIIIYIAKWPPKKTFLALSLCLSPLEILLSTWKLEGLLQHSRFPRAASFVPVCKYLEHSSVLILLVHLSLTAPVPPPRHLRSAGESGGFSRRARGSCPRPMWLVWRVCQSKSSGFGTSNKYFHCLCSVRCKCILGRKHSIFPVWSWKPPSCPLR